MALFLDKSFNWIILAILNIAIILSAEFVGGGTFFEETGLIHIVVLVFVALIIARIFSEYAFGDYILRGFLKIQLGFFLFLGLIHVYEYLGIYVLMINDVVVESTATISYFLWLIGNLIALEFVFRIYKNKSATYLILLTAMAVFAGIDIVAMHIFSNSIHMTPEWTHGAMLTAVVATGAFGIWRILNLKEIMPVFKHYASYAIPAIILIVLATFSEYSESEGFLRQFNISDTQNLYISHFLVYGALSLLLIAYGKLKRPTGIYSEM